MAALRLIALTAMTLCGPAWCWAGPPFQTDDPEPIEFRHYELYTFASFDGTNVESDASLPAVEFNWGALPNVHIHFIIPSAEVIPSNQPTLGPSGAGRSAFGLGDIEMGIKLRFIQETKHRPMVGTFPMFEIPTGDSSKGLGVGRTWYKLPLWLQKSFGPWTTYGGGGLTVVPAHDYRNFPFAGWLAQRDLGKKVTLGSEVYYHAAEGLAAAQTRSAMLVDIGGYYKFRDPGFQLLFCYGHSAVGQPENYAYVGLYWTWGRNDKIPSRADTPVGMAFNGMAPPGLMGYGGYR